ncbi:MAG: thiamine phosphate synthase [Paracoccaceae bacterium]
MAENERPQIYLITPPEFELERFADQLAGLLDVVDVACVRLALSSRDEERILRAGDALRALTHARDVALVIQEHVNMVTRLGLDGVHLGDGAKSVRQSRGVLGRDAIIGAYCATSRHSGINAAEAGADYVSFGPLAAAGLGDGQIADPALFSWWSEMIEVPVVAEGNLDEERLTTLSSKTDFFAFGPEVWNAADPVATLRNFDRLIG